MAESLPSPEYERLADIELRVASSSTDDASRRRHLDQAAVYAHLAEKAEPGPARSDEIDDLIQKLSALLAIADKFRLTSASIHIDAAIIALGGVGTPSPEV